MSAHYPARPDGHRTDDDIKQDILPPVVINEDHVTIGDINLPGQWIEQDGITVTPGSNRDVNRVTATFLVGAVDVSDDALPHVSVEPIDVRTVNHAALNEWAEVVGASTPRGAVR